MMKRVGWSAPGLAALLASAGAAHAATAQEQALARWRIQDKCIADSVKANPDHTLLSQQRRDAYVDKCLTDHGLPKRAHMAPSDPPPGAKIGTTSVVPAKPAHPAKSR